MYSIYFLESIKDGMFYIGCTSRDPEDRLAEHNKGVVRSTRYRTPFKLVYVEKFEDTKDAFRREWHLKHPSGYLEKLEIIKKIKRA